MPSCALYVLAVTLSATYVFLLKLLPWQLNSYVIKTLIVNINTLIYKKLYWKLTQLCAFYSLKHPSWILLLRDTLYNTRYLVYCINNGYVILSKCFWSLAASVFSVASILFIVHTAAVVDVVIVGTICLIRGIRCLSLVNTLWSITCWPAHLPTFPPTSQSVDLSTCWPANLPTCWPTCMKPNHSFTGTVFQCGWFWWGIVQFDNIIEI